MISHLQCGRAARVGNRDHDIDIVIGEIAHDLAGKLLTHAQTRLVDREIVENGIRAGKVHVLENARRVFGLSRVAPDIQHTVVFDVQAFSGFQVTNPFELQRIERHAF